MNYGQCHEKSRDHSGSFGSGHNKVQSRVRDYEDVDVAGIFRSYSPLEFIAVLTVIVSYRGLFFVETL